MLVGLRLLIVCCAAALSSSCVDSNDSSSFTSDFSPFSIVPNDLKFSEITSGRQSVLVKQDKMGRPYVVSNTPETQVLLSISQDHTWDKYGPTILIGLKNTSDQTIHFTDRAILVVSRSDLETGKQHVVAWGGVGVRLGIESLSKREQERETLISTLATFSASAYTPGPRMDFGPALRAMAEGVNQGSGIRSQTSADESQAFLDSTGTLLEDTDLLPGAAVKAAVVLTGVRRGEALYMTIVPQVGTSHKFSLNAFDVEHTTPHAFKLVQQQ